MINVWNNLDIQIKVAVISAVAAIVVAIITGVFSLIKKDTNSENNNKGDSETINIPTPRTTDEQQKYNSEDYIHNSFIPSLDKLEKEKSDDAFAEGLATFIGADRSDDEISITRKGK